MGVEASVNQVAFFRYYSIGAAYPNDALRMREILPRAWFLVPSYGAQGGGADGAVAGIDQRGLGVAVSSSRGITFAYREGDFKDDPKSFARAAIKAAEFSRNDLNATLERVGEIPF